MMQTFKANTILVLDLDDTLYKEADYVLSGIEHTVSLIKKIKNIDLIDKLLEFHHSQPKGDFLEFACIAAALPASAKESLLWSYRTHLPNIHLSDITRHWLTTSRKNYHAVAILTDGRSVTQRLKLAALGLTDFPVYISEEWNSEKPHLKRFLAIQERWKNKNYIYIGDNLKKDFIAPKELGWITIGLQDDGRNIHPQNEMDATCHPKYWIKNLTETCCLPI
jgi:putative hydrolase of the HAD superfamily